MTDLLTLLFDRRGRIGRLTFVLTSLALGVIGLVLGFAPVVGALAPLAILWPATVLAIKRSHDLDRTGGLAVVAGGLCAVLAIFGVGMSFLSLAPAFALVAALVGAGFALLILLPALAFVLWLALAPGSRGANRYGAPAAGWSRAASVL